MFVSKKKSEFFVFVINFNVINRALTKFKQKKLKMKTTQIIIIEQLRVSQFKLQRLRQ